MTAYAEHPALGHRAVQPSLDRSTERTILVWDVPQEGS
jgi:hypothetical protein